MDVAALRAVAGGSVRTRPNLTEAEVDDGLRASTSPPRLRQNHCMLGAGPMAM